MPIAVASSSAITRVRAAWPAAPGKRRSRKAVKADVRPASVHGSLWQASRTSVAWENTERSSSR